MHFSLSLSLVNARLQNLHVKDQICSIDRGFALSPENAFDVTHRGGGREGA